MNINNYYTRKKYTIAKQTSQDAAAANTRSFWGQRCYI